MKKIICCLLAIIIIAVANYSAFLVSGIENDIANKITVPRDGAMTLNIPESYKKSDYLVLSGNAKTSAILDHSAWVHSLNFAINPGNSRSTSYGFNILYSDNSTTNLVQLYRTDLEVKVGNDSITRNQFVNKESLEKLFKEGGFDFKIVRLKRMVYFLADLDGYYEIIGRMYLPIDTPTDFYFSDWKTETEICNIKVEVGKERAVDALGNIVLTFDSSTKATARNFLIEQNDWTITTKVFDTNPEDNSSQKRMITVEQLSLLYENASWRIQRMKSGDWSSVPIPDEISNALTTTGMYIKFVRSGNRIASYVSADGSNYTFIKERTDLTDTANNIEILNYASAHYEKFNIKLGIDVESKFTLGENAVYTPLVPSNVSDAEYSVLSGNMKALCEVDHSKWVHSVNIAINPSSARASSYGFNILYSNLATNNLVQLYRTDLATTFNGDTIPRNQVINRESMENIFSDDGIDFKLVRLNRLVYLLVNIEGYYEIIGRMYLPEDISTEYYFSNWSTPTAFTNIEVKTGENAADEALDGMVFNGLESNITRNLISTENKYTLDIMTDTTSSGNIIKAFQISANSDNGKFLRFVRDAKRVLLLASNNGSDYTLVEEISVTDDIIPIDIHLVKGVFYGNFKFRVGADAVDSALLKEIVVVSGPDKTEYIENENFDKSGIVIETHYYDGRIEITTDEKISVVDPKVVLGQTEITVSALGKEFTIPVTVKKKSPSVLEITVLPKTIYKVGNTFSVENGKYCVTFNNGEEFFGDITANMCRGYDMNKLGEQTVTVSYSLNGIAVTGVFTIKVTDKELINAVFKNEPTLTDFVAFETFVPSGTLNLSYDNGTIDEIPISINMCSGYNTSMLGVQTVTVSLNEYKLYYNINVGLKMCKGIQLLSLPEKTVYSAGQNLNLDGSRMLVTYRDNTSEVMELTDDMIYGFDPYIEGAQRLEVKYSHQYDYFEVKVVSDSASPKTGYDGNGLIVSSVVGSIALINLTIFIIIKKRKGEAI